MYKSLIQILYGLDSRTVTIGNKYKRKHRKPSLALAMLPCGIALPSGGGPILAASPAQSKGIPAIMTCTILIFMWSLFGPLMLAVLTAATKAGGGSHALSQREPLFKGHSRSAQLLHASLR